MGRVGVAEAVRMKRSVAGQHARVKLDDLACGAIAQSPAAAAQQQRALIGLRGDAAGEIAVQGGRSFRAIWNLPLLPPLAPHANPLFGAVEVVEIQSDQFADAESAAVEKLEEEHIALRLRTIELG